MKKTLYLLLVLSSFQSTFSQVINQQQAQIKTKLRQLAELLDYSMGHTLVYKNCRSGKARKCVHAAYFSEKVSTLNQKTRYQVIQESKAFLASVVSYFKAHNLSSLDYKEVVDFYNYLRTINPDSDMKGFANQFRQKTDSAVLSMSSLSLDMTHLVRQSHVRRQLLALLAAPGLQIEAAGNMDNPSPIVKNSPFKSGLLSFTSGANPTVSFSFVEQDLEPIYLVRSLPFHMEYQRSGFYRAEIKRKKHAILLELDMENKEVVDLNHLVVKVKVNSESSPIRVRRVRK